VDIQTLALILLAVIAAVFILSRFLRGDYGNLRLSGEVGEAFLNAQVKEQVHYYSSGPEAYPNALMGLDKAWVLQSDLWKKRDLTSETMKALVLRMQEENGPHHGFDMVDAEGRKIGEWFSTLDVQTTIKMTGAKTVTVSTPPFDNRLRSF